jgi:hypothetical protein
MLQQAWAPKEKSHSDRVPVDGEAREEDPYEGCGLPLCPTDTLTAPHPGLIDLRQVVFKGKALEVHRKRRPRTFTAEYHLKSPSDHKRVHVCLSAFLGILVDTHCMYAPCRYVL